MKRYLPALIPAALCVALFGMTVFWLILPRIETVILESQKEMARHLTHTAWSVLDSYHRQVQAGVLTQAQAQAEAINRLRMLRHGHRDQDYFWINDMTPNIIMHPNLPGVIDMDVTGFRDAFGRYVFRDVVRIVREKARAG
jgi:Cache domain.